MVATPLALNASSVSQAWRNYNVSLRNSPVATKAVTCMAAYVVGDLSAQLSSNKAVRLDRRFASIDVMRTARMALYGLLWSGPAGHAFYGRLDRAFANQSAQAASTIAGKVMADQLIFAPVCTAVFFAWANLAAGNAANIPSDLANKLLPSVKAAWALWVPAMAVNMALIPPHMRVLFINATTILWTNILSSMAGDAEQVEMPEAVDFTMLPANEAVACSLPARVWRSIYHASSATEPSVLTSDRPLLHPFGKEGRACMRSALTAISGSQFCLLLEDDCAAETVTDDGDLFGADTDAYPLAI